MQFTQSRLRFVLLISSALISVTVVAVPAAAQSSGSTYVGASFIGEFGRFGGVDVDDDIGRIPELAAASADTTTMGFSINAGRAIGRQWGVEFALGRGATSKKERRLAALPAFIDFTRFLPPPGFTFPEFVIETAQQHTTFDALLWLRNELGERVDLRFLGGVSFTQANLEQEISIAQPQSIVFFTIPRDTETVEYGVGPVVGAEAIVDIAEHVAITGGVRIQGINVGSLGGWLIRPAVGLRWTF